MCKRDQRLELIKLIATGVVVMLHVIRNSGSGNIQLCLYFLGTFGIPLFLMVNGYLLYDRDLTFRYLRKKTSGYLLFIVLWTVVLSAAALMVKRRVQLFKIFSGALLGKGRLFHLWFLTTLLLILSTCCIANWLLKRKSRKIQNLINRNLILGLVILMSCSFLVDFLLLMPQTCVREIIPAPFRLITNGGYFLIGMYQRRLECKSDRSIKCLSIASVIVCYAGICVVSLYSSMRWASSFYPSLMCIIGSTAIMRFCLSLTPKQTLFWKVVRYVAPMSIGIWVLHPLVLSVIRKLLELAGIEFTLALRVLALPVILVGCMLVTKIGLKIKGVKLLFQV